MSHSRKSSAAPAGPTISGLIEEFSAHMRMRNYSEGTIHDRHIILAHFATWLAERGMADVREITRPMLERYQRHLYQYRQKNGKPLAVVSQVARLHAVKAFFRWAARQNLILSNPAADLEMPRGEHRLPKQILTATEVERILAGPDVKTVFGLRDRALMEVLYSTGMRRMEVANLTIYDLNEERGVVHIRQGKGKKDRMCPMGERAFAWVRKYAEESRPQLLTGADDNTLFLANDGGRCDLHRLTTVVRRHIEAADLGKRGSCHLFRHTCATLMLENGADVRFIQQLLGHSSLETTQIYAQVSIRALKEVHTRTHPGKLTPGVSEEVEDA